MPWRLLGAKTTDVSKRMQNWGHKQESNGRVKRKKKRRNTKTNIRTKRAEMIETGNTKKMIFVYKQK